MASKIRKTNGISVPASKTFEYEILDTRELSSINEAFANVPKFVSLEDCDVSLYQEFHQKFKIKDNFMPLIILDMEIQSIKNQNAIQFDLDKNFLNGPYFTYFRTAANPKWRSNPSTKDLVAIKPINTPGGIVLEETLATPVKWYDLKYEFKFITNLREYTNQFEPQVREYFKNTRNIIVVNGYRFTIRPEDWKNLLELEIINKESVDQKTYYVLTMTLIFEVFIRTEDSITKRLRPNKWLIQFNCKEQDERKTLVDNIEVYSDNQPNNENS